jgi:3-hydroxyisobutyrate dehydrogenase
VNIAFIGLGNMGNPMCRNLLKHRYALRVYDVVPELAKKVAGAGCEIAGSAQEAVRGAQMVITMLPSSPHVRRAYLDARASSRAWRRDALVDCSTIDPLTARDVAMEARGAGLRHARRARSRGRRRRGGGHAHLHGRRRGSGLRGGEAGAPGMGKNVVHCGASGNGQVAKICNNMMLAVEMIATSEAMTLAARWAWTRRCSPRSCNTSSGRCWSSDTYNPYPGVLENVPSARGYSGGFGADLMLKDLGLVADAARVAKHPSCMGALAQQLYQKHSSEGHGAKDFSSDHPAVPEDLIRHEIRGTTGVPHHRQSAGQHLDAGVAARASRRWWREPRGQPRRARAVITGAGGKFFSAGADLEHFRGDKARASTSSPLRRGVRALHERALRDDRGDQRLRHGRRARVRALLRHPRGRGARADGASRGGRGPPARRTRHAEPALARGRGLGQADDPHQRARGRATRFASGSCRRWSRAARRSRRRRRWPRACATLSPRAVESCKE